MRQRLSSNLRIAKYAIVLALLLAGGGLWAFRAFLFERNFHVVIPNEVYRSGQPSAAAIEHWIRELNLRSVFNLRGECNDPMCRDERERIEAHGVDLHLIGLKANRTPHPALLQQLVHLLDNAKRPLLLHCGGGVHRSGLASAVAVLLSGGNIEEARKQFGLTYGYVALISRSDLPIVLSDYEQWIASRGWSHTPDRFRSWAENDYIPYFYGAQLKAIDLPTAIAEGSMAILKFRATNTSLHPWHFRSVHDRGVHLGARIRSLNPGVEQEIELRSGFRDLTVLPGESVGLQLEVPPSLASGCYLFLVDLVDEHVVWFSDMGSDPVTFDLCVEAMSR